MVIDPEKVVGAWRRGNYLRRADCPT